jgi:hypothetical protein
MGAVNPKKLPRTIKKRDGNYPVDVYKDGGEVGLYANIHAKRKRIAKGSGEKMRPAGKSGAPTAQAFKRSALTAKR